MSAEVNIDHHQALKQQMRRVNMAILEPVLALLEAELRGMGSGYQREIIWRYIRRYPLTADQLARLEAVAVRYLERPTSREFRVMCITMTVIGSVEFWKQVEEKQASSNQQVRINAKKLYPYSISIDHGERQRLTDKQLRLNAWFEAIKNGELDATFVDTDLLGHICQPQFWQQRSVMLQPMPDAPLYFGYSQINSEFERLDLKYCQRPLLIAELHRILQKSGRSVGIHYAWIQAIYLLVKLGDPDLPQVLEIFYKHGVAYRFETITKSILNSVIEEALKRHRGR